MGGKEDGELGALRNIRGGDREKRAGAQHAGVGGWGGGEMPALPSPVEACTLGPFMSTKGLVLCVDDRSGCIGRPRRPGAVC